jgi:hypothetical protein
MRPPAIQQAHVEAILASLFIPQHAAAMKVVAFDVIWQAMCHVTRPACDEYSVRNPSLEDKNARAIDAPAELAVGRTR